MNIKIKLLAFFLLISSFGMITPSAVAQEEPEPRVVVPGMCLPYEYGKDPGDTNQGYNILYAESWNEYDCIRDWITETDSGYKIRFGFKNYPNTGISFWAHVRIPAGSTSSYNIKHASRTSNNTWGPWSSSDYSYDPFFPLPYDRVIEHEEALSIGNTSTDNPGIYEKRGKRFKLSVEGHDIIIISCWYEDDFGVCR